MSASAAQFGSLPDELKLQVVSGGSAVRPVSVALRAGEGMSWL